MFDHDSGRCLDCDGHYTHSADCAYYEGDSVLTVAERVEIHALVARIFQ